ncbi:hypothetical protein [Mesorhizobium sp. B2-3-12]|uniref:hypothetical protein n=1 Tax=Mesorhizobium sp. B2-3-12 TaxID=2589952 RepID=UPI001AEE23ED|nr:hypothetical protein [Mesorhizobium sp. B2-3-12]
MTLMFGLAFSVAMANSTGIRPLMGAASAETVGGIRMMYKPEEKRPLGSSIRLAA